MGPAEGDSDKSADDDRSRRKERLGVRQTNSGTATASCYHASSAASSSSSFHETSCAYGAAGEGSAPAQVLSATLTGQARETCPGRSSEASDPSKSVSKL